MTSIAPSFQKRERMVSRKLIDTLCVPKKHFKHAVDRNRIKRQVREAFRQHKQLLYEALAEQEQLLLAFIWLSDEHYSSQHVESRVVSLMQRVAEKL